MSIKFRQNVMYETLFLFIYLFFFLIFTFQQQMHKMLQFLHNYIQNHVFLQSVSQFYDKNSISVFSKM